MQTMVLSLAVLAVSLCACGMNDGGNGNGCLEGYTECGSKCCVPGMICESEGNCEWPYQTAQLYVYLCPDFNDGCDANYFMLDQTCSPIGEYTPGTCYNTGFEVNGGRAYGLAVCQNCPGNCSNPVAFVTPEGFSQPTHDSQIWWYCQTTCTQPGACP